MTTCQCCGQPLTEGNAAKDLGPRGDAIWVDDALMRLCNHAFDLAQARNAREVTLAHFAAALATGREMSGTLARFSISASRLAADARRAMAASDGAFHGGPPQTSMALRTLLARARDDAARRGATLISTDSILQTLLDGSADLAGADLFNRPRAWSTADFAPGPNPLPPARVTVPQRQGREDHYGGRVYGSTGRHREDFRANLVAGHRHDPSPARAPVESPSPELLMARLQRQETRLGALLDRAERLARTPTPSTRPRDGRDQRGTTRAATAHALSARQSRPYRDRNSPANQPKDEHFREASLPRAEPAARSRSSDQRAPTAAPRTSQASGRSKRRDQARLSDRLRRRSRKLLKKSAPEPLELPANIRARGLRIVPSPVALPRDDRALELDDETIDEAPLDDDLDGDGEAAQGGPRQKRFYLAMDDYILHAPSIGPSTAGRLMRLGINTVRDMMACDPVSVATRVNARHVTAQRIAAWQAQARLVCTVPWLRGTHAQLLVGAGFETVAAICAADRDALCVAVLKFAVTRSGMSVLRSGPPPEIEKIVRWVEHANMAEVERAA